MAALIGKNKARAVFSSLLILLPMALGGLLWGQLGEKLALWDGRTATIGRSAAVFILPAACLALHWLCLLLSTLGKKEKKRNRRVAGLIFWVIPFCTLFYTAGLYGRPLGREMDALRMTASMGALLLVMLGNLFPRLRPGSGLGIKVRWATGDDENWRRTHRFAGLLFLLLGFGLLPAQLLPNGSLLPLVLGAVTLAALAPVLFSFFFHLWQNRS